MARSLSVKVPTASLIAEVEAKISEIVEAIANYPIAVKQYKEDYKAYKQELVKAALKALKNPDLLTEADALDVGVSYREDLALTINKEFVTLPKPPIKPEDPSQKEWFGNKHLSRLEMLQKNLKVLKMTQQEEVNASTYSSVMELL
jgi:hypothetical protein